MHGGDGRVWLRRHERATAAKENSRGRRKGTTRAPQKMEMQRRRRGSDGGGGSSACLFALDYGCDSMTIES